MVLRIGFERRLAIEQKMGLGAQLAAQGGRIDQLHVEIVDPSAFLKLEVGIEPGEYADHSRQTGLEQHAKRAGLEIQAGSGGPPGQLGWRQISYFHWSAAASTSSRATNSATSASIRCCH